MGVTERGRERLCVCVKLRDKERYRETAYNVERHNFQMLDSVPLVGRVERVNNRKEAL